MLNIKYIFLLPLQSLPAQHCLPNRYLVNTWRLQIQSKINSTSQVVLAVSDEVISMMTSSCFTVNELLLHPIWYAFIIIFLISMYMQTYNVKKMEITTASSSENILYYKDSQVNSLPKFVPIFRVPITIGRTRYKKAI